MKTVITLLLLVIGTTAYASDEEASALMQTLEQSSFTREQKQELIRSCFTSGLVVADCITYVKLFDKLAKKEN